MWCKVFDRFRPFVVVVVGELFWWQTLKLTLFFFFNLFFTKNFLDTWAYLSCETLLSTILQWFLWGLVDSKLYSNVFNLTLKFNIHWTLFTLLKLQTKWSHLPSTITWNWEVLNTQCFFIYPRRQFFKSSMIFSPYWNKSFIEIVSHHS